MDTRSPLRPLRALRETPFGPVPGLGVIAGQRVGGQEQAVDQSLGRGWAAGNEDIHGHDAFCAVQDRVVAAKDPPGNGAAPHGDHDLGRGNRRIGPLAGELHVPRDRAGDQDAVGEPGEAVEPMPKRSRSYCGAVVIFTSTSQALQEPESSSRNWKERRSSERRLFASGLITGFSVFCSAGRNFPPSRRCF